jgi:broad specificity phosphatase PhoE
MRIILARHAETDWNVEGRYQGQTFDIPLSITGQAQARAMASRLASVPLARAASSPLLRAMQTAEMALGKNTASLQTDPRFMEMAHGAWEGRLAAEIHAEYPEVCRAWRETPHLVTLPGGESFRDVQDRAWPAFCSACEGLGEEDTALIVSHDGVNRAILCRVLGLPLERVWSFRQAPACLNLLEGPDPEHLAVVRLNDAAHLAPLFGEVVHRRL